MAKRLNFRERRKQRYEEAAERQEERIKRTPAQQLKKLEDAGHGHCKEADRLRTLIEEAKDGSKKEGKKKTRRNRNR